MGNSVHGMRFSSKKASPDCWMDLKPGQTEFEFRESTEIVYLFKLWNLSSRIKIPTRNICNNHMLKVSQTRTFDEFRNVTTP